MAVPPVACKRLEGNRDSVRGREGLQTPESGGAGDKGGSSAGGTWLQNACNHTLTKIGQFHSAGATLRCDADWSPKVAKGRAICSRLLSPPPSRFRSFRRWSRVIAAQAIVQIPRWGFTGGIPKARTNRFRRMVSESAALRGQSPQVPGPTTYIGCRFDASHIY